MLKHTVDAYNGVNIEPLELPATEAAFTADLQSSLRSAPFTDSK